jgi:wyosine [tRNA(Phe)-imidazoG37] synthetase (radical SAM superfamily)
MSVIRLQKGIIYGPVNSRRLGHSLGINVLPLDVKICSFDCQYCQYGWSDITSNEIKENTKIPGVNEIADTLEKYLLNLKDTKSKIYPDYITFSGNGEPTMHPDFTEIVDIVIKLRNKYSPKSMTAILSNSTKVNEPVIRIALSKLDVRIMKFDSGDLTTFNYYNNPAKGIHLHNITEGLSLLKDTIIQSLFTEGRLGNYNNKNITEWINRLKKIKPLSVQIYTIDRGFPSEGISKLDYIHFERLKILLEKEGIRAEVFN